MVLITNEEFLIRLETAFQTSSKNGTVFLTMKRHPKTESSSSKPVSKSDSDAMEVDVQERPEAADDEEEFSCLMRAKQGSKIKFSTLIHPDDTDKFLEQYAQVVKRNAPNIFPASSAAASAPPAQATTATALDAPPSGKKKLRKKGDGGGQAAK